MKEKKITVSNLQKMKHKKKDVQMNEFPIAAAESKTLFKALVPA